MPGLDGTGPKGYGPITGRGRGFCILKMPYTATEPITGFVGLSGRPVTCLQNSSEAELTCSRADVQRLRAVLDGLQRNIGIFKTNRIKST